MTTALSCSICGADRSKAGRPFDGPGLSKHVLLMHGAVDGKSGAAAPLTCDICGANRSLRGKLFLTAHSLHQHMRKNHPAHEIASAGGGAGKLPPATQIKLRRTRPVDKPAGARPPQVRFCPHCGLNLAVVHAAMEFVNGDLLT